MTITSDGTTDPAVVERLSTAFNRCFETFEAPDGLFTPDVFCDLMPPFWRLQLEGPDALMDQLRAVAAGARCSAHILRVVPTTDGFVLEHEETQRGERTEVARRVFVCTVVEGRIAEVTCYCNGGWDDELRTRHAAEAPMLRP